MLMPGPASATQTMSRLGWRSRWNATGTGLAQPNRNGEPSSSRMPGSTKRPERVDVADRVEADPAQAACRVVAQPVGHPAMRRLVQRDRGHHRHSPDRQALRRARRDRSCDGAGQQLGQPRCGRLGVERLDLGPPQCRQDAVEPGQQRRRQRRHGLQHGAAVVDPSQGRTGPDRSRPPAPPGPGRRARPQSACIARSSLSSSPCTPSSPRMVRGDHGAARSSPGDLDRAPGRRHARSSRTAGRRRARDRHEIAASAAPPPRPDHRQLEMAVDHRAAMTRQMLDHRRYAAGQQPLGKGSRPARPRGAGSAEKERLPMASVMPGVATSSTGAQSTSIPTSRRSCAISRPSSRAASRPAALIVGRQPADIARPPAEARHSGGRRRITRPPSWSMKIGSAAVRAQARAARRSAPGAGRDRRSCAGTG